MPKNTEISYSNVNWLKIVPHFMRPRLNAIIVEAPGYPFVYDRDRKDRLFKVQQFRHLKDKDGHTVKQPIGVYRGFDKRIKAGYTGVQLRAMRAKNGVGRPPQKDAA